MNLHYGCLLLISSYPNLMRLRSEPFLPVQRFRAHLDELDMLSSRTSVVQTTRDDVLAVPGGSPAKVHELINFGPAVLEQTWPRNQELSFTKTFWPLAEQHCPNHVFGSVGARGLCTVHKQPDIRAKCDVPCPDLCETLLECFDFFSARSHVIRGKAVEPRTRRRRR